MDSDLEMIKTAVNKHPFLLSKNAFTHYLNMSKTMDMLQITFRDIVTAVKEGIESPNFSWLKKMVGIQPVKFTGKKVSHQREEEDIIRNNDSKTDRKSVV